jgi:flagellin-like protein
MSKKGVSAIVATVLIILITVAAVTVIWAAVIPMISDKLDSSTLCLDAVSQVQLIDEGYTCRSKDGSNVSVQIRHLAIDVNLADVQVLISSGGDTTVFRVKNSTTTLVPTSANILLPGVNEEKVYIIDTSSISGTMTQVKIAPIVDVGGTENICDVSAAKTLRDC